MPQKKKLSGAEKSVNKEAVPATAETNAEETKGSAKKTTNLVIALVVLVALCLVFAVIQSKKKPAAGRAGSSAAEELDEALFDAPEDILASLGRTVYIGESLKDRTAPGTELIAPQTISGLDEALNRTDVDVVIRLLKKADIRHVIVDPKIARKDPMPTNTVRNRLAFSLPAAKLQAIHLRRDITVFKLGDGPPPLDAKDKQTLINTVRAALGAKTNDPGAEPSALLKQSGNWQVIATLRPLQNKHLSIHFANGKTLIDAARDAAGRIKKRYAEKGWEKEYGPLETALNEKLVVEFEVVFDQGVFTGPRDNLFMWRVVEPGITGLAIRVDGKIQRQPPWISMTNTLRTVESLLDRLVKNGGKSTDYWKRPDVAIERFRTVHWREVKPGGDIQDLFRGWPRIIEPKEITPDSLKASLDGLTRWISFNSANYKDHRMIYRYFPVTDDEGGEYNMVRHALGAYSMALGYEFNPNPAYKTTADSCIRWILDRTRYGGPPRNLDGTIDEKATTWQGKPLPGPDVALYDADENMYDPSQKAAWSNKMGGVAVAVLGLTQYRKVGWELTPEQDKLLKGLANFLLYMQKEDGSFHHYYVAPTSGLFNTTNSIYPGEIMYAIARLYGETKDERYRESFKKSMDASLKWFTEEMAKKEPDGTYVEERRKELVQFQPWIAMSMEEMYRYDPDPAYVAASNLVSLWIIDTYQFDENRAFFSDYLGGYMKVLDELPAMHAFVYTEGTAASYVLARAANEPQAIIDRLRKGCLLTARFILQMQIRKGENDWYFPNPQRAEGGVNYCMNHSKQRIDYTYHALSSVYRILHAATPEDYAFIQSMDLPKNW